MKRRKFLVLTTVGSIATLTPFCTTRRTPAALFQPVFLSTLCDLQTLKQIGTTYRKTTPGESRESQLKDLLTTGLSPTDDATQQLSKTANADFAANRTVTINGWIISVTEARQCALLTLQPS